MAQIVLTDVTVTINSVALTALSTSVVLNYEQEAVEVTAFGDGSRKFTGGLKNITATVTLQQDFATSKTEATIYPLVGTTTTVVFQPAAGAVSATNPSYTITGAFLASHTPINGAVGELSTTELTFQGGTLAKSTGA